MGVHYSIVDHTEKVNVDLGKGLNSKGVFQFAHPEVLSVILFTKKGNRIEFGTEEIDVESYEDIDIDEYISIYRRSDLSKFLDLYQSLNIILYPIKTEKGCVVRLTEGLCFKGRQHFYSEIEFDHEGKFISQGFFA